MKKWFAILWMAGVFAFSGMQAQAEDVYTVKTGDTLSKTFGEDWKAVCEANSLKDCNKIRVGQKLQVPVTQSKEKSKPKKPDGVFNWRRVAGAPLNGCGGKSTAAISEEAWGKLGLSDEEKVELRTRMESKQADFGQRVLPGKQFVSVAFCEKGKASFKQNVVAAWPKDQVVTADTYVLASGRKLLRVNNCGNWAVDVPFAPPPPQEAVQTPPDEMIPPVHAKEGDTVSCEAQAGVGAYTNKIYRGHWVYGEGICYVFKNGEWQHGPGVYAMGGQGESRLSAYHNKERGLGFQYGVQRNFMTDDGDLATFELKARLLADQMSGKNLDAGYWVKQKGLKAGLYGSYYERHGDDLYGVIGEYWHGFNQSVRSSWSGQQAQDRGSLGIYGVYEHQLSDDDAWRLRWIGGAQHTNWDSQNWLRLAAEFRYKEWLMFGPQISLPFLGISGDNSAFSAHDLTTLGAFVRVELGKKVRDGDADTREAQLEFIPAHSSSSSASGELAGEAAKPLQ
ncbi:MAG: LysM peptidoglycan-binding domain-containing protein [Candidatus Moraniibacteriota bacterium]